MICLFSWKTAFTRLKTSKKQYLYYLVSFQQSSICRAAIHLGAIDNNGGLVDVTRMDRLPFFVKATKNGIESLR